MHQHQVTGGPQQGHQPPAGGQFKDLPRSTYSMFLKMENENHQIIIYIIFFIFFIK